MYVSGRGVRRSFRESGNPMAPRGGAAVRVGATLSHSRLRRRYSTKIARIIVPVESSPLARARRSSTAQQLVVRRVIPARAGFTRSLLLRALWSGSHSRSRRLCRIVRGRSVSAGITPARAGFTALVLPAVSTSEVTTARRVPDPCVENRGPENRVAPARAGASARAAGRPDRALPAKSSRGATPARAGAQPGVQPIQ